MWHFAVACDCVALLHGASTLSFAIAEVHVRNIVLRCLFWVRSWTNEVDGMVVHGACLVGGPPTRACMLAILTAPLCSAFQGGRAVHKGGVYGFRTGEGPSAGDVPSHKITIYNHHYDQVVEVDVPEDR